MNDPQDNLPVDEQVQEAINRANEILQEGRVEDGYGLMRLQIAHSLGLALADAVAQTRRLQTLAISGQAAAQRSLLDGGDPDSAQMASSLGHQAVEDSTRDVLELARAALSLFAHDPAGDVS